jgi:seipin
MLYWNLFNQLTAELLSVNGAVIAKSSQPCMLRFRSFPIRLARTFIMGMPLLLGISHETQRISIEILKHKEGVRRTKAIRVTLAPRAGTLSPPQLYDAEILIHSHLPWTKQLVTNWKWTLYVWTSLYIYIMLLIGLVCCCKRLIFPMTATNSRDRSGRELMTEEPREPLIQARDEREISELMKKWKRSRGKRKAICLHEAMTETIGSSTPSISVSREDTSTVVEEDIGDSESVCLGG